MRFAHILFIPITALTLLAPDDVDGQSTDPTRRFSKAMNPKLALAVRDYLDTLPLQDEAVSKQAAGDPYFTYVGGDSMELGISAHQFPNGSVVLGIQTQSPDLPVTDDAPRKNLSGIGADWYIVHFDPNTGETFFASYYGTDQHDWLSSMECEDSTFRCIFAGASQRSALGKTESHGLFVAIMGFIDPITLQEAYQDFCSFFGLDPGDWFSNAAFWMVLSAAAEGEASAKYDPAAIQLGAGICGFRTAGDRINGLIAIVNPGTCQLENVLESTFETDDTFYGCFSDTGLDGTPIPVISGIGIRDDNADFALNGPSTPTLCYAHQNETEMTCTDMPAAPPLSASGKTMAVAANDEYQAIQRDADLGTFALGWNSTSGYGFIDYWPSTDHSVVSSTAPLRASTDFGHPFAMHVSNMGRVSFSTDWWDSDTYFGQRIGTYAVTNSGATGKTAGQKVGGLAFMNWTALPGVNRGALTTDIDDYPFQRGYSGASWFGIEVSATALQSDCPSGQSAVCASFGEVNPGLSYVSACNLTGESVGVDFSTSSPGVETDSGFFFDITDTGSIEPGACSRMYMWPTEGGFGMDLTPTSGSPASIGSMEDGLSGPFSTVILSDAVHSVNVSDAPTIPHTYAIYFTNTLAEAVDLRIYGEDGDLFSASLDPLTADVFNADPALLGETVYIAGMTGGGLEEVFALDLPTSDFVMQSLVAADGAGKSQGFEILVFNAMGSHADTRVVTSIEDAAELPESYALHGNYPNPFNPSTTITYDLPEATEARLIVLDALGRVVESLVAGHQSSGRHAIQWDAKDAPGGVYFVRLETRGFVETRKMTLLK